MKLNLRSHRRLPRAPATPAAAVPTPPSAKLSLRGLRPGPAFLPLLLLWFGIAVSAAFFPIILIGWYVLSGVLALLIIVDGRRLWRHPPPDLTRRAPSSLPIGVWRSISLTLANSGPARRVAVFDEYLPHAEINHLPQTLTLPAHAALTLEYLLRPTQRGTTSFGSTQLLLYSPFNLWACRYYTGAPQTVRVYPNFAAIAHYALLATDNHLSQLGVRQRRRRGAGLEFHQLREYRPGDALRQLDWKATARTHRLIARDYQDERDQQVIFLLDCSRRMRAKDDEMAHFDNALDAMLLLAYVALRQGDGVGLLTFGGAPDHSKRLAPVKGVAAVNTLLNTVYDLQPSHHAPDYLSAARLTLERFRKRSLIVVLSNVRDEDNAELQPALRLLGTRHLVLLASLRERVLRDTLLLPIQSFDDALRYGATHHYLACRQRAHNILRAAGARLFDVEPQHLAVTLVNRYLDIKRAGAL